jgi:O-ureido-D-serine cyclo-ligase
MERVRMPRIALVTAAAARATDEDLAPLEQALHALGAGVDIVDWDDASAPWADFDAAVLRSCWDYTERIVEFLVWAERISHLTRLVNPFEVVRWNTDKHYLSELAHAGVAIVPSRFIEPGDDAADALRAFLENHAETELVVKPAIGAGSRDTQRHSRDAAETILAHARRLLDGGRSVLLQPYLDRVDETGETALIHFRGRYSHAIRKGPLLRRGEGPTEALYAAEQIEAREPGADEHALAAQVLAALPFADTPAYARIDLIRAADGQPMLLELELTEPSLFFAHAEGSATRFAEVLLGLGAGNRQADTSLHPMSCQPIVCRPDAGQHSLTFDSEDQEPLIRLRHLLPQAGEGTARTTPHSHSHSPFPAPRSRFSVLCPLSSVLWSINRQST